MPTRPLICRLATLSTFCASCALSHSVVSDSLDPVDYSPRGSSLHGIFQARILEWVAISYSRGSSRPRDWTRVCWVSFVGRQVLYHCVTRETHAPFRWLLFNFSCALLSPWLIGMNCWFKAVMLPALINTTWVFSVLGKIMRPSSPNPQKAEPELNLGSSQLLFSTCYQETLVWKLVCMWSFFLNRSIVDVQCCVSFRCIAWWLSYIYIYIYIYILFRFFNIIDYAYRYARYAYRYARYCI